MIFLLFWLGVADPAQGAGPDSPPSYTDVSSAEALRTLEKLCARDPAALRDDEGVEWAKARFAMVALLRLQGKDKEAMDAFAGCGSYCRKWGSSAEWKALRKWGCAKKKDAIPCLGAKEKAG